MNDNQDYERKLKLDAAVKKHGKSKVFAWILWVLFGWLGFHRYYTNQSHASAFWFFFGAGYLMMGYAFAGWMLVTSYIFVFGIMVWWLTDAFKINQWIEENHQKVRSTLAAHI